ncbi:uncharacterized protein LY79DRAFT_183877 [Colletotrichum navitas]|uniref:Uncharacterized protein n=1 Tax=Colletotrichum navitas TaxID=681940 RepID=A0AAD8Q0W4_9PEZI|nr:uncharacterized protein LY79DRAFT_183877 [Colletotrichum navitas]KAK1593307.1 hypothetical protein LY79DRAFT_183877 [Colletotrichum navitas]
MNLHSSRAEGPSKTPALDTKTLRASREKPRRANRRICGIGRISDTGIVQVCHANPLHEVAWSCMKDNPQEKEGQTLDDETAATYIRTTATHDAKKRRYGGSYLPPTATPPVAARDFSGFNDMPSMLASTNGTASVASLVKPVCSETRETRAKSKPSVPIALTRA